MAISLVRRGWEKGIKGPVCDVTAHLGNLFGETNHEPLEGVCVNSMIRPPTS